MKGYVPVARVYYAEEEEFEGDGTSTWEAMCIHINDQVVCIDYEDFHKLFVENQEPKLFEE